MIENKAKNLFEKAIRENSFEAFILGEGDYFFADREYGEHWYLGVWLYHIVPVLEEGRHEEYVKKLFSYLLEAKENELSKMNILMDHLFVYYYILKEKRIKVNYIYSLEDAIIVKLKNYKIFIESQDLDNDVKLFDQTMIQIKKNGGLLGFDTNWM